MIGRGRQRPIHPILLREADRVPLVLSTGRGETREQAAVHAPAARGGALDDGRELLRVSDEDEPLSEQSRSDRGRLHDLQTHIQTNTAPGGRGMVIGQWSARDQDRRP